MAKSTKPPHPLTELSTNIESQISEGRRAAILQAVRTLASTHTLDQILSAVPEDDVDFVKSCKPIDLVPQHGAPAPARAEAPATSGNPFVTASAEASAPARKKKAAKKAPPPRAPAAKKAAKKKAAKKAPKKAAKKKVAKKAAKPKAEKSAAPAKETKAGEMMAKIGEMVGKLEAGKSFKTGDILALVGDPKARVKVTAALNAMIESKKIKRSGSGRSSFYTVLG